MLRKAVNRYRQRLPIVIDLSRPDGINRLSARDIDEPYDEERSQEIDEPIDFAKLTAKDLEQAEGSKSKSQSVGDAECQRYGHHGQKGGNRDFRFVPRDF